MKFGRRCKTFLISAATAIAFVLSPSISDLPWINLARSPADTAQTAPVPTPTPSSSNTWQPLWDQYIGGKAGLPAKVTDLKEWLIPDGKKDPCAKQVNWVLSNLSKYGDKVFDSDGKNAQKISTSIYDYLSDLHSKNDSCYEAASGAYLLGSVFDFSKYDASKLSALVTTGCGQYCEGPAQSLYLLLLTKALLHADAIKFVTPSSCVIEFAYLCDPGAIQLNPISKPIDEGGIYGSSPEDFAGHYIHELNHLFRDKFVSKDYVTSHFPDPTDPSGIDWKSYLLLDETMAKVMAASIQISNQQQSVWDNNKPNVVGNDLTLFLQNGPLEHLIDGESGYGLLNDIFAEYSQFIGTTFLRQPFGNFVYGAAAGPDSLTYIQDIYVTLQNSYFPGVDPSGSTIDLTNPSSPLNPINQSLDFDPLNTLLSKDGWGVNPYVNQKTAGLADADVWSMRNELGLMIGPFTIKKTGISWKSPIVVPITMFLREIAQVVDSLKSATPICQAFDQELIAAVTGAAGASEASGPTASGGSAMSEYLGGSCIKSGTSQNPVQPENGGRTDQLPTVNGPVSGNAAATLDPAANDSSNPLAPVLNPQIQPGQQPGQPGVTQLTPQMLNGVMLDENGGRPDSPGRP